MKIQDSFENKALQSKYLNFDALYLKACTENPENWFPKQKSVELK